MRASRSRRKAAASTGALALGASLGASVLFGASCTLDPVASAQQAAYEKVEDLGPDNAPNTEYHRPGQDCLACHGPRGSANSKFEIAGTVFWSTCLDPEAGPDKCIRTPVDNAEVRIHDRGTSEKCIFTNCSGNFFVRVGEWLPTAPQATALFPLLASVRKVPEEGGEFQMVMQGHISRWGSCNDCHRTSPYWNSAGQIYLTDDPAQVPASAAVAHEACMSGAGQVASSTKDPCTRTPQ